MLNSSGQFSQPVIKVLTVIVLFVLGMAKSTMAAVEMEAVEQAAPIKFAVLAFRPKPETAAKWQPLVDYLNASKIGRRLTLEVLTYPELEEAVKNRRVGIVLTQPAHYIHLAHREGLFSPLATLVENEAGHALAIFGGVIVVQANQSGIQKLADLHGKRIAVSKTESLGGFQMQALELLEKGVNLPSDAKITETGMPHDKAVMEVLAGRADAAFVRTGVLEAMQREGKIDLRQLRIINPQVVTGFPFLLSTRLYPEWALAAMPWLEDDLARRVAAAILGVPHDGEAAKAAGIHGFTIPGNYKPVENLMRQLRSPPFDAAPSFNMRDVWSRYMLGITLIVTTGFALLLLLTLTLLRTNHRYKFEHQQVVALNKQLSQSEARHRNLVVSSPDWIWEVDAQGIYTYASPRVQELLGYTPEEIVGRTPFDLMPPEEVQSVGKIFADIIAERRTFHGLGKVNLHKDGRQIVLETSGVPIIENGVFLGYLGVDRDITERKHIEEELERHRHYLEELVKERTIALREAELRYRTIADFTYDWETWNDAAGRWIYCSPSCQRITGYDAQSFMDDPQLFLSIIHFDDMSRVRAHMESTCYATGEFASLEFRIVRPDGKIAWIEHACQPAFDSGGTFIGHRASNRDITGRKKIEKTMQALATAFSELTGKTFFEAICHHLADTLGIDYVFIGKFEASLDRVNVVGGYAMGRTMGELTYELSGTPCANVVGKTACFYPSNLQILFPKDRLLAEMRVESYAGIPIFDKLRNPIGILVALHTGPLPNSQPIVDFLQVFSDRVAAEMQRSDAEEALRQVNQELQLRVQERTEALQAANTAAEVAKAASRAKSAFLANMSHELRTPMNHIMGMTALALRSAADPRQQDQLQKVVAASQHLLELINDILDLSKIEAERLSIECVNFNLGEVISNLKNIIGQKAADKGLVFRIDVPDTLVGQLLLGDPLRLSQILINLAGNAIKFTQAGHVIVRVLVREETPVEIVLCFEVEDTGIGISAEDQKRLFQAFEQADNSMTRKYGGSGLGLAISKCLVQMMGGEIGVKSESGQGSTFWFTARLGKGSTVVPEPVAAKGLPAKEQLQIRHSNMRILVVDDDPINMMVTQDMLEQVGMRSDAAIDGYEAVVLAQEYPYDLILMDMQMPVLNGLDATRAIRIDSLNLKTPIVAMTANVFEEDRRACLDAGMCDHVAKPFLPEQLYEAILRWLDQPNLKAG